jgi:NAD(P)-dependent dehydrogenase (short-subunit alcohol dehydrogenase family)
MKTTFQLEGKKIILVGATGILGRTYAKALKSENVDLVLADHPATDVEALATQLNVHHVMMDVTVEMDVIEGVQAAINTLGGLDGVINNAAATGERLLAEGEAFAPLEEYPLDLWKKTIDTNLTGTFLVARECGKYMKKQRKGGAIVNVSSVYGVVAPDHRIYEDQPFKSFPGYSASKAGVLGLTRWMATWWGKDGIRVNSLTPGGVFNQHNKAFVDAYSDKTPLGRMANKEDMLGMLLFLLSDLSAYCTGQNYIVDGGFTAW